MGIIWYTFRDDDILTLKEKDLLKSTKNLYAIIRLNNKLKKPEDVGYLDEEIANFVNIKMARKSNALLTPWLTTKEECAIQSVYSWCWDYICFLLTYWSPIENIKLHKANLLTNHSWVTSDLFLKLVPFLFQRHLSVSLLLLESCCGRIESYINTSCFTWGSIHRFIGKGATSLFLL